MKKSLKYLVPTLLVLLFIPIKGTKYQERRALDAFRGAPLRCALALGDYDQLPKGFLTGFHYELLSRFGEIYSDSTIIFLAEKDASYTDSLLVDSLDILVIPSRKVTSKDRFTVITPADTGIAWVIKKDPYKGHEIIKWSNALKASNEYLSITDRFFEGYNPYRNGRRYPSIISPYDALLKKSARIAGWDWRLLAALMWNESMFRIQVRSPKGALGLMQMMPRTAGRYGVDDILDPEVNIDAAARYLARLNGIMSGYTSDPEAVMMLVIAAYNCGEGRALEDLDGREQSSETAAYVKGVLNQYDIFRGVEPRYLLGPDGLGGVDPGDEQAGDQEEQHDDQV